jgi:opacity protein-like surface antigen
MATARRAALDGGRGTLYPEPQARRAYRFPGSRIKMKNLRLWLCLSAAFVALPKLGLAQDDSGLPENFRSPYGDAASYFAPPDMSKPVNSDPWTGFYLGATGSYGFGTTNSHSVLISGGEVVPGTQLHNGFSADRSGMLSGLDFGYHAHLGRFMFGTGLDFSAGSVQSGASERGVTNVPGYSAVPFSGSQNFKLDRLLNLREQLGFLVTRHVMLYGFGGLAAGRVDSEGNLNFGAIPSSKGPLYLAPFMGARSQNMVGWSAGLGGEYMLSSSWGSKLEYAHYALGKAGSIAYQTTQSGYHTQSDFPVGGNTIRIAIDYHFNASRDYSDYDIYSQDFAVTDPGIPSLSPLRYDLGTRYWYSQSTFRYGLGGAPHGALVSRLSYTSQHSNSGEIFGSAQYPHGVLIRAMVGTGGNNGGSLQDQDFPTIAAVPAYSSTQSTQKSGALTYSIVDAGYAVFARSGFNLLPFLGFTYMHEQMNAYGCVQTQVNGPFCAPAPGIYPGALGISENATWTAMRVGMSANYALRWHDLRFGADAAWLPYGALDASDSHWLRINTPDGFSGPILQSGTAQGVQLEVNAKMALTQKIDFGVGARYWYIYTHGSSEFFQTGYSPERQATTFSSRRAGEFVELSTHF